MSYIFQLFCVAIPVVLKELICTRAALQYQKCRHLLQMKYSMLPRQEQKIQDERESTTACADKCIYAYIWRRQCWKRYGLALLYFTCCIVVSGLLVTTVVARNRFVKYLAILVTYDLVSVEIFTDVLGQKGKFCKPRTFSFLHLCGGPMNFKSSLCSLIQINSLVFIIVLHASVY